MPFTWLAQTSTTQQAKNKSYTKNTKKNKHVNIKQWFYDTHKNDQKDQHNKQSHFTKKENHTN